MNDLSTVTCEWDASLLHEMTRRWVEYCESLEALSSITINRWLGISETQNVQLQGFCDASTRAYATAVYLHVANSSGSFGIHFIASRSKVAPIKTVNILNLELWGAVLLVQLVILLRKLALYEKLSIFLCSDSSQNCQYPLYLNPDISVETPIRTVATWPSIQYINLIQRALLNVNIVNIHCICSLTLLLKLEYEP
jgi:hypothetical protein